MHLDNRSKNSRGLKPTDSVEKAGMQSGGSQHQEQGCHHKAAIDVNKANRLLASKQCIK